MHKFKKLKHGLVASTIIVVLTLSFAQLGHYSSVNMSRSFTIADQPGLPGRGNMGMAYDSESDVVVIFAGWNQSGNVPWDTTWTYDYNSDLYTEMDPATSPAGRAEPAMTYDSVRDEIVLFGGMAEGETQLNDTWTYDFNNDVWTEIFPANAPSKRRAHEMVYDTESDRVILFGGGFDFGSGAVNDTWSYHPGLQTWTEMSPSIAPPARFAHKMAYDWESDKVILFGGFKGGSLYSDPSNYIGNTWAYDFNSDTWENLTTTGSPSARGVPSLSYDGESDRVVLFGGSMSSNAYDDTWLFDYNTLTWQEMSPTTSPSARTRHGSAYDSESDKVIIYGGARNGFNSMTLVSETQGKTWGYDMNTNTWEEIGPRTTTSTTEPPPPPPPIDPLLLLALGGGALVMIVLIVIAIKRK
ncbi:MAG: Kelch repeat-containing protein [Candidatus Thorarchaeota archaeon]